MQVGLIKKPCHYTPHVLSSQIVQANNRSGLIHTYNKVTMEKSVQVAPLNFCSLIFEKFVIARQTRLSVLCMPDVVFAADFFTSHFVGCLENAHTHRYQ